MGEAKRRKEYAKANPVESNWGEDRTSHSFIVTKEPPPSLVRMRDELAKPWNKDIYDAAIREPTFETVLGTIAAKLSIALDGYYNVPDLCEVLYQALAKRVHNRMLQIPSSEQVPGLVKAVMIEGEDDVQLMEFDEAVKHLAGGTESDGDAPYTVCNSCLTSFTCCAERKCVLGKEVTQLGKAAETVDMLKRTIN